MPSPLAQLTDSYLQDDPEVDGLPVEPLYTSVPVDADGKRRVYISTARPAEEATNVGNSKITQIVDKLLGTNGQERYQLWPEKVIRGGLAAAGDVYKEGTLNPGLRREDYTDTPSPDMPTNDSTWLGKLLNIAPVSSSPADPLIEKAQDMSALAGTGGLAGADATLGATPFLRPALKYKDKLYKGQPGQQHLDVIPKELYPEFERMAMSGEDLAHYNFGFMNHKGQFLDREKALEYAINEGLVDAHAGQYGALTSTLMVDSSKPGMAIEAMGKTASPFYSAVERNVRAISQDKMTGEQWLGTLSNKPGVKPEELQWTGLKSFLEENKGKPVTKDQIAQHLEQNKVELKEVGLVDKSNLDPVTRYLSESFEAPHVKTSQDIADARKYNAHFKETTKGMSDEEVFAAIEKSNQFRNVSDSKYHSYQLPGGENYREMLLTLPPTKNTLNQFKVINEHGHVDSVWTDKAKADAWAAKNNYTVREDKPVTLDGGYKSSHWDEPNILAHVRMNDRTIDGKKSLHLEEIQSDWHQQGRDKGYKSNEKIDLTPLMDAQDATRKAYSKAIDDSWLKYSNGKAHNYREARDLLPDEAAIIKSEVEKHQLHDKEFLKIQDEATKASQEYYAAEAKSRSGVPDAPFKKSWHELALKRMVREAAEKGYDRLSWTPGEAQAARYDLSKQVDNVDYNFKTKKLTANKYNNGKYDNVISQITEPEKLADFVGKEVADKLLNKPSSIHDTKQGKIHVVDGLDLKIGGEGMKGFYDQIIPKSLEKMFKEHGVKVQNGIINADKEGWHITPPTETTSGKWMVKSSNYNSKGMHFDTEAEAKHALAQKMHTAEGSITPRAIGGYRVEFPSGLAEVYHDMPTAKAALANWKSNKNLPIHYIDIPQSLKDHALKRGFPLFSTGVPVDLLDDKK